MYRYERMPLIQRLEEIQAHDAEVRAPLEARIKRLEGELRQWTVHKFGVGNVECCVCCGTWNEGEEERHIGDCLNRPALAEKP